jgi:hypothetical protein
MTLLDEYGVTTWLAGGWVEELYGMAGPRSHHDVGLLYPAATFALVDQFLRLGIVQERSQSDCHTNAPLRLTE